MLNCISLFIICQFIRTDTSDPETPQSHSEYTCLFIQLELCREYTLKDWFKKSPTERPKSTVIKYMKQVNNYSIV